MNVELGPDAKLDVVQAAADEITRIVREYSEKHDVVRCSEGVAKDFYDPPPPGSPNHPCLLQHFPWPLNPFFSLPENFHWS